MRLLKERICTIHICVDNSAFKKFDLLFDKTVSFVKDGKADFDTNDLLILFYADEMYWDLQSFLSAMRTDMCEMQTFLQDKLVVMNAISSSSKDMKEYSGVSLLAMTKNYVTKVRDYDHLQFFQKFDMALLYSELIGQRN